MSIKSMVCEGGGQQDSFKIKQELEKELREVKFIMMGRCLKKECNIRFAKQEQETVHPHKWVQSV